MRYARHRLWQLMPAFPDLNTLNLWLEERCKLLWAETAHGTLPGSIADILEAEKPALMPLPTMFDGFVEERKRVSPTCLITFDRNRYSVPASFANRPVSLRIYPERLVVVAEGHVVCAHERIIERSHRQPGRIIYDWRHYLAVVQRKPGALRNGAPFVEIIFSLDGLGLLGFEAALSRDYPVMFGTLYFFTLLGLLLNLLGDVMYTLIDPRIDFDSREC